MTNCDPANTKNRRQSALSSQTRVAGQWGDTNAPQARDSRRLVGRASGASWSSTGISAASAAAGAVTSSDGSTLRACKQHTHLTLAHRLVVTRCPATTLLTATSRRLSASHTKTDDDDEHDVNASSRRHETQSTHQRRQSRKRKNKQSGARQSAKRCRTRSLSAERVAAESQGGNTASRAQPKHRRSGKRCWQHREDIDCTTTRHAPRTARNSAARKSKRTRAAH